MDRPIFVVHGYDGELPTVTLDGKQLWLTLNRKVQAPLAVTISP